MQTRALGTSGLSVSAIGLGCNNFGGRSDAEASRRVIDAALDHGITFFDTADIYADTRSETVIGEVLEGRRDKVFLATKFGKPIAGAAEGRRGSRGYVRRALEASLRRLRTDHIDLYQMHEPDAETPIEETLGVLEELVAEGKIRFYGASNYSAAQLRAAHAAAAKSGAKGFISSQDELSLVERGIETSLLPEIEAEGLAFIPYFPLGGGLLTGKYQGGARPEGARLSTGSGLAGRLMTEKNFAIVEKLQDFAAARGCTLIDLAFQFLLARPSVASVIAGATRVEQIVANAAAAEAKPLSADELKALDALTRG